MANGIQSQSQAPAQAPTIRNGHLGVYVGEKGVELIGRKHDGSQLYKLYTSLDEAKAVLSRFEGNRDENGNPSGWRSFSKRLGRNRFTIETVVDGRIVNRNGVVFTVTMTSNAALAIAAGYDNRPPSRVDDGSFDLDGAVEAEEQLI